ncbi:MAG: DUF4230 domain-containing protein [Spirochaetales bacterium]|uniref:DUF4230 domain-containing protein n=1 Tax=Candidatus Thalassospirochaeta sargassi TaxID=3119039 RepID=A0AAJ1IBY6_9SPIO|nr:DUF4230 domain-containing protein [Spirochaetales bacterium]
MKTKRRPRGKKSFPTRLLLTLLILIAVAVIIVLIQHGPEDGILGFFAGNGKTASSTLVLQQVRNISRLNTIEFIYKSVFPYDLIKNEAEPADIFRRFKAGERLNAEEIKTMTVYGIAIDAGIDIGVGSTSFAVISVRITAGYDFPENLSDDMISINETENVVHVKLPPVRVTEIIIDDADSSVYDYPDLNVSPEQWRVLTSIMSDAAEEEALRRGILLEAEKRGKYFIERMLLSSGYSSVVFSE